MPPFSLSRAQCRLKAWATDIAAVLHNPNVKDLHPAAHDIWQHVLRGLAAVQACACDPAAETLAPSILLTVQDLRLSELSSVSWSSRRNTQRVGVWGQKRCMSSCTTCQEDMGSIQVSEH